MPFRAYNGLIWRKFLLVIPSQFNIISPWHQTLGGIYISTYESGSILQYNELIVFSGWVSYSGQWGRWIFHFYVDDQDSVIPKFSCR
ncbi:hypothetical protein [Limnoraphis robusta]|uniref:hypothetical protein n=1 Tax=Limnoraphis robusta TaxID=1118279 RepID=UPI002B207B5C|nr:hypothetical protein [Limnoraphis robusta]